MSKYYHECRQLHLKTQRMVSCWDAVSEYERTGTAGELIDAHIRRATVRRKALFGTLVYAGAAAIYAGGLHYMAFAQPIMLRLSIWLGVGFYGVLFCQWTEKSYAGLFYPLWIGFVAAWISMGVPQYLLLAMGLLIWVRSGQCIESSRFIFMLGRDFLLSYGSLAAVVWIGLSTAAAPMGPTLLFCALQGLYFVGWKENSPDWLKDQ